MHDYVMLVENRRVTVNMHQQLLGCQDTSDLRQLGTGAEVSVRHFGTSDEMSGYFGTVTVVPKCLDTEILMLILILIKTNSLRKRKQK